MIEAGKKITSEELAALFPGGVPMAAMKILFPESSHPLTVAEVRHVLSAMAPASAEVKVRDLEWVQNNVLLASATDPFGNSYTLMKNFAGRGWFSYETGIDYPTVEAAKAAAQADFERRIRSALAPPEARS